MLVDGKLQAGGLISWDDWRKDHKSSILGVQPLLTMEKDGDVIDGVLNNVLAYGGPNYINFETYNSLAYVPEDFNSRMLTSLYLGEYQGQYKELGLCDPSVRKLEHFKLEDNFRGSMGDFFEGDDVSVLGYVRLYKVID